MLQRGRTKPVSHEFCPAIKASAEEYLSNCWTWVRVAGPLGVGLGCCAGYQVAFGVEQKVSLLRQYQQTVGLANKCCMIGIGGYVMGKIAYHIGDFYLAKSYEGKPLRRFKAEFSDGTKFA